MGVRLELQPIHDKFMDVLNKAVLCYVDDDIAWFTTLDLKDQWGDDWNDAPYESNAGRPYSDEPWQIFRLRINGCWDTPEYGHFNSPYSVEDINSGAIAWLSGEGEVSGVEYSFPAGMTMGDFIRKMCDAGYPPTIEIPVVQSADITPSPK
jgi:hypothetical protein